MPPIILGTGEKHRCEKLSQIPRVQCLLAALVHSVLLYKFKTYIYEKEFVPSSVTRSRGETRRRSPSRGCCGRAARGGGSPTCPEPTAGPAPRTRPSPCRGHGCPRAGAFLQQSTVVGARPSRAKAQPRARQKRAFGDRFGFHWRRNWEIWVVRRWNQPSSVYVRFYSFLLFLRLSSSIHCSLARHIFDISRCQQCYETSRGFWMPDVFAGLLAASCVPACYSHFVSYVCHRWSWRWLQPSDVAL